MFFSPLQSSHSRRESIKYALRLRSVTLNDVARELGVSNATVSVVILGRRRSRRIATHVANLLGSNLNELWPNMYPEPEVQE
ncbi:helix-turn-helix domain-containing protein [Pseudogemmobacter blasticus]|uniref:DNA-binding protein n=1 Tax=Fuscovulum blasticum DSM 2131 TaxID=1188250 RepID=A0A2T4J9K6_FUSBL|nr:DNA-binding protein [Fuscovulum blasticum DSM 2131]